MKISIITTTYNSSKTISDCITSVNNQTYSDIEHIIIDGASIDNTIKIIDSLPNRVTTIISEPDKGIYDALNKGIHMATGDVIGFLHSDDIYASDKVISTVVDQFHQTSADVIYGDLNYVNKNNTKKIVRYWKSCPFHPFLLKKGWMPPHSTFFAKRELYQRYGVFDTSFRISADYDLMLRFLKTRELNVHYIPEVLIHMRLGGQSNKSLKNIIRKTREDWRAIKKNETGNLLTLLQKNTSKIRQFIPDFHHIETGKNLDRKM
jgi:glycosyltransferase